MTPFCNATIVLTALREDDVSRLLSWRSDPKVRDDALGYPFPSTIEAEREWIRSFSPRATPSDLCLAVRELTDGPLLGYCQLRSIDWIAGCAEFGIIIGAEETRGRGIGRKALEATIRYASEHLHLRRLWLRVAAYNKAAISLYQTSGFSQEGCLIRHAYRHGDFHDVLIFGREILDTIIVEEAPSS